MHAVGIDSCLFTRTDDNGDFSAPMGVAVTLRDRDHFRVVYGKTMSNLFKKYGHVCKKPVYKAASLTTQLLHLTNDFLKDFLKLMSPEIQRIDVFYTFYPDGSVENIITCGDSYPRRISSAKFLRQIEKGYEHYCVWKYCEEYPLARGHLFEVDHFTAKITPAWDKINDLENFSIFFSGGECNKAISLADLVLRFIVNNCKGRLNYQNINDCLKDHVSDTSIRTHWMGHARHYLNHMAYRDDFDIDLRNNIQHPIFWIAWDKYTSRSEEKTTLEWTSDYIEVMKKAEEAFGSVRFWNPRDYPRLVDPENDVVVLLNEEAVPILKSIQSVTPKITVFDSAGVLG